MEIGLVSNISSTNEANSVKNTGYTQEVKKPDYSKYNLSQIKDIEYEEAKMNYQEIKKRLDEIDNLEGGGVLPYRMQLEKVNMSDNNNINKAIYETLKNEKNPDKTSIIDSEIQNNLADYYYGKDLKPSWMVSNDSIHINKNLTKSQINSIDFNDFISKMVGSLEQGLSSSVGGVKEQYKSDLNSYDILQKSYDKAMRTPYYA